MEQKQKIGAIGYLNNGIVSLPRPKCFVIQICLLSWEERDNWKN